MLLVPASSSGCPKEPSPTRRRQRPLLTQLRGGKAMAWNVTGQLMELCNCNVECGCWFGPTKPDQGWCGGALIFEIRQGAADGINLGGRKIALAAEWPADFWSGNGKARLYVD